MQNTRNVTSTIPAPSEVSISKKHIGKKRWEVVLGFSTSIDSFFDNEWEGSFYHRKNFEAKISESERTIMFHGTFSDCKTAVHFALAEYVLRTQLIIASDIISAGDVDVEKYIKFLEDETDIDPDLLYTEYPEILFDNHLDQMDIDIEMIMELEFDHEIHLQLTKYIAESEYPINLAVYALLKYTNMIPSTFIPRESSVLIVAKSDETWIVSRPDKSIVLTLDCLETEDDDSMRNMTESQEYMDEVKLIIALSRIPEVQFAQMILFAGYQPSEELYKAIVGYTNNPNSIFFVNDLISYDLVETDEKPKILS